MKLRTRQEICVTIISIKVCIYLRVVFSYDLHTWTSGSYYNMDVGVGHGNPLIFKHKDTTLNVSFFFYMCVSIYISLLFTYKREL